MTIRTRKYKIVATGELRFTSTSERTWIEAESADVRILSIAGVPWDKIPTLNGHERVYGRDVTGYVDRQGVAVRPMLSQQNFEIEIVNG
jgi:hypothetical protein